LGGKTYLNNHTMGLSRKAARLAERRLAGKDFDLIFAPAASTLLAHLKTSLPVVSLSDATFARVVDYLPEFTNAFRRCQREADTIERLGIRNANLLLFSNSWAAESAIRDYQAPPEKVHVVPFGANFEGIESISRQQHQPADVCRILFVGVSWKGKGGDIAFETLLELEKLGVSSRLTIVGCVPPSSFRHPHINVIPFLNKNDRVERGRLAEVYTNSDFFLLPTRCDCSPIVTCEACAFGLPVIATQTGGVPEIVRDGVNGYLLPLKARGADYAKVISGIYRDPARHEQMRKSARLEFETRLNWDAWGKTVADLLKQTVNGYPNRDKLSLVGTR